MTSQILIVNYDMSANAGQLFHHGPPCSISSLPALYQWEVSSRLSLPSTSTHAGLTTPAEDHTPQGMISPGRKPGGAHTAAALLEDWGLPPAGLGSGKGEPLCSHHHPRWERRALFSTLSPAGAAPSSAAGMGLPWVSIGISSLLQLLQPGCPRLGCLLSCSCVAATDLLKEIHQGENFPSKHP